MGHVDPIAAIAFGLACAIAALVFIGAILASDDDGPGSSGAGA